MLYEFETPENPELILEKVIKSLVSLPEEVEIDVTEGATTSVITIDVVPDDRGKIIGRRGCIIHSLKTIFHAIGCKRGKAIILEIKE